MKSFKFKLNTSYNPPIYIKYIEPYKFSYNFIVKMKTPIRNEHRIQYIDVNSDIHSQR